MRTKSFTTGAFLVTALMLYGVPANAAAPGIDPPGWSTAQTQTEKFSKTVPLGRAGHFELSNISGDIVVTGVAGDQVVIEAVKRGRTADELKLVTIDVMASQGRVEVETRYPRESRNLNVSVYFTVMVPKDAEVRLNSVSGDIKASTIDGLFRAESVSGDVDINGIGNLEAAKSVSGDVIVESAGSPGELSVGSVSGDLELRNVKARSLDLSSVSGEITVTGSCERLAAKSVSGTLRYAGPLSRGGRYELQSHSGDVIVETGEQVGFEVTASSFSGDINSDVALAMTFGGGREGRRGRRQEIRGTFGDGSAKLVLTAFSGDIRIVRK
ncbi:MAG: DUF4097 family beta strand repeat-containing protein [Acidobacteriota bacterium]